ncbi:MAG: 50S ribosomal protein L4 [Bacteroidales bacterium]|nr:50S ribosomal protein L4 [Bacteroidales bacterium]
MELNVLNKEGKETGRKVTLPDSVFAVEPNDHAIYLDVKQFLANNRQGTHKSKERSEVAGSTRKIKKQKGTGGARAGALKSPVFVGGGRIFGPRPRNYSFKLNKKVKALARYSALSYKAKEQSIFVVEDFSFEAPKSKNYVAFRDSMLKAAGILTDENLKKVAEGRKKTKSGAEKSVKSLYKEISNNTRSLVVLPDYDNNIYLSARNLNNKSEVAVISNLNTYQVMKAKVLVLFESTVAEFEKLVNA